MSLEETWDERPPDKVVFPIEDLEEVSTLEPPLMRTVDKLDVYKTEEISIENQENLIESRYFNLKDKDKQGEIAVTLTGRPPSTDDVAVTGNFGEIKHRNIQSRKGLIINKSTFKITGIIAVLQRTLEELSPLQKKFWTDKVNRENENNGKGRLYTTQEGCSSQSTYWEPPRGFDSIQNEIIKSIDMEKWKWMKQLADAVDYLHRNNIIHRDVTPRCCLIDEQRDLKLADFGSPVTAEESQYPFYRMGPAMYYSLEVLKYDLHSFQADVYSFLMTAIFISSNINPFDDTNWENQSFMEVCQEIESGNRERAQHLPPGSPFASSLSSAPSERPSIGRIQSYFEEEDPSSSGILKALGKLVTSVG